MILWGLGNCLIIFIVVFLLCIVYISVITLLLHREDVLIILLNYIHGDIGQVASLPVNLPFSSDHNHEYQRSSQELKLKTCL